MIDVSCLAIEQAAILRAGLDAPGMFHTADGPDGGLRVTLRGGDSRGETRRLDFALGLCVIGTEIYDSRRVELQLRGRSGRQGEFGLARPSCRWRIGWSTWTPTGY